MLVNNANKMLPFVLMFIGVFVNVGTVTPLNPCDPMRSNVSVESVLTGEVKSVMMEYHIYSSWFVDPLRYVNCSRRGLLTIPETIPTNVQILDLSSNAINQLQRTDLEKLVDLQVLWLHSNCIGGASVVHFYCKGPGTYDRNAFSSLANLKLLDLGGNNFDNVPSNLPPSLEYLDVSRTGLKQVAKNDLSHLKNLLVFIANNVCFYQGCRYRFQIDPTAFEALSIKLLKLSENTGVYHSLQHLNSSSTTYLNIAQTQILSLQPQDMKNLASIKRLDMYLQNPNRNIRLKVNNNSFDELLSLEYLDVSCNWIEYLPNDIFRYNHQLTYLDLSGNCLLESVADPKYVPFQIKYLYLGFNQCFLNNIINRNTNEVKEQLGPSFSRMVNLTLLSFAKPLRIGIAELISTDKAFPNIGNDSFLYLKHLQKLTAITISNNHMREVDMKIISCMQSLTYIDLSRNIINNLSVSNTPCSTEQHKLHYSAIQISTNNVSECTTEVKIILSYNMLDKVEFNYLVHPRVTVIDLSFNLISTIHDKAFKKMPCLTHIDLRNNPIVYIHFKSFMSLANLNTLLLSSTSIIQDRKSVLFMKYLKISNLYLSMLNDNLFQLLRKSYIYVRFHLVTDVDLSNNRIISVDHLQKGLKIFFNATSLTLKQCNIPSLSFSLPNSLLTYLDLTENDIREVTFEVIRSVPLLKTLILSRNSIKLLSMDMFSELKDLNHLDLSHNYIAHITSSKNISGHLNNLKILELQRNYIFQLSQDVFPYVFLDSLHHLDLRYNSIECSCDLSENFGRWLSKGAYNLSERPGLLPRCSSSVSNFGGCVKCTTAKQEDGSLLQQSLLQYATNNFCSSSINIILTTTFTSFCFLFTLLGLFFTSSKGLLWIVKFATRRVRSSSESEEGNFSSTFAFHGFVVFDTNDQEIGDWVDDHLVPNLTQNSPKLRVAIVERDDQCGFSPVKQLLYRIEASRKVLVVLTKNYERSNQGKYVLSVLETLHYQTGNDRVVIVMFETDLKVGNMLRRRRKNKQWSQLQFPEDERDRSIFWESLRNSLL